MMYKFSFIVNIIVALHIGWGQWKSLCLKIESHDIQRKVKKFAIWQYFQFSFKFYILTRVIKINEFRVEYKKKSLIYSLGNPNDLRWYQGRQGKKIYGGPGNPHFWLTGYNRCSLAENEKTWRLKRLES